MKRTIVDLINQRERQVLIHSYLYYEENDSIIGDTKWDEWAKELAQLIRDYPDDYKRSAYYGYFDNFEGDSGCDLKFPDEIIGTARYLQRLNRSDIISNRR